MIKWKYNYVHAPNKTNEQYPPYDSRKNWSEFYLKHYSSLFINHTEKQHLLAKEVNIIAFAKVQENI